MENNIAELRKRKSLTQRKLAEKLGFSRVYMCQIENGKKPITSALAIRIAKELDCSLDDIFFTRR